MRVHLYSHVSYSTGYGRAGREIAYTLLAAGVELEILPLGAKAAAGYLAHSLMHNDHELYVRTHEEPTSTATPDVIIVHTMPLDCGRVLDHLNAKKATLYVKDVFVGADRPGYRPRRARIRRPRRPPWLEPRFRRPREPAAG